MAVDGALNVEGKRSAEASFKSNGQAQKFSTQMHDHGNAQQKHRLNPMVKPQKFSTLMHDHGNAQEEEKRSWKPPKF